MRRLTESENTREYPQLSVISGNRGSDSPEQVTLSKEESHESDHPENAFYRNA